MPSPSAPTDVDAGDRRQRILSWAQRALTYYVKVGIVAKVTDFNRSWQNGVGLLCLIHLVDPNLVPDIAAMSSWLAAPHTVKTFDVNAYLAVLKDLRIVYSADQRQWQSTCDRALRLCANESVGVSPAFGLNSTSLASLTADENDVVDLIEQFQRRLGFSDLPGGKTEELSDLSNVEELSEQPKAAPLVEAASIADSNGTSPQQYTQQVVTTVRETTEHSEPVVSGAVKGIKSFWEALTGSHSQPHERPAVVEQKVTGPSSTTTTKETTVVTVVADSPATADIAPAAALETTVLNDSMGPQVSETSVPPESTITKTITTVVSTVEELPEDPVVVDSPVPTVGAVVQPSGKFPRRTVSFSKSVVPATVENVPTLQINVIPTEQTVTITQTTKDVIVDDALTPKASELPSNRVLPLEVAPAQITEIEEVQLNSEPVAAGNETAQQISAQSLPRGLSTTTNTTTTTVVTVEEQLPPKSPSLVSTILSGARSYAEVLKNAAEKSVEVVETAVTDAIEKFNEPKHHEEVVQISETKPVKTASDAPSAIIPLSVDSSSSSEPLVSELSLTANAEPKSNVSKEVIIEEPTPGTSVIRTVTTTTYVTTPDVDYSTPSEITVSERRPSMKFAPRSTSLTAKSSGEFLPESAPVISVAENDPSVFQAVVQEPETIQTITETYPDSTVTKTITTRTVTVVETVNDEESEPLVQDSSLIATPDVLQTSSLPKSEESLQGNPEILSDSKAIVEETETFSSVEPEVVVVKQSPIISQQIIEPAPQVPKKPSTSGFNFMSFVSSVFDKHPAEATVTQEPAFGKRASFVEPAGPSTLAPDYATPVNSQAKRPSTSGFSFKAFVDGIPGFGSGHEHEYSPVATNPVDSDLAFDKVITTEISPANAVPVKPFEISSTEIANRALPLDAEYSNSPITTKKTVTTTVTTMSEPAKPLSVVETISQPVVVEEKIEKESDDTANDSSSTFNFISFIEPTLPSFTFSRDGDQKTEVFLDDKSVPLESNDGLESRARNLTFSNEQVVPAGPPASTVRTIKTTTVVRESVPETVTAGNVSQVVTQAPESSFSFKSVLENSVPDYVDKTAIPTYTFDQVVKETVKAPSLLETINEEQVPPFSAVTTTTEEKETDSPSSKRRNILSDDSNSFSVEASNSTFPETVSKAVEEEKPKKKKFVFTRIKSASSLGSDGKSTPVSESSDYRSTPEIEHVESSEVQTTMEKSIAPENVTEIISTENTIAPEIVSKTIEAENSVIPADAAAASQSTETTTTITTTTVTVNNADGVPETVKTVETVVQKDGDTVVSETSENRAVTGESTGSSNGVQSSSFSTESQNIGGSEFTKGPVVSVEQESIAETKASNEKANSSVSSKQKEREVVLSETYKSHVLESDEVLRVCEYELTSRFNDYESFNKDDLVAWVKEIKTTSEMFIDVGGQVLNDEWNEHWFAAKYIPPHMNLIERARKIVERLNEFTRTKLSV
ncbi:hypothetical protein HDU82_007575 [Entophlyctis luteolus]|nr:hypothetical protein HDU82_007575 [Entophlyctis luteolus]